MQCPRCQQDNPPGSRFCNSCGTRLESADQFTIGNNSVPQPSREEKDVTIEAEKREGRRVLSRGVWIALATFVPTFLSIFFGMPYLVSRPVATRSPGFLDGYPQAAVSALVPQQDLGAAAPRGRPVPMMPSEVPAAPGAGHPGEPSRGSPSTGANHALGDSVNPVVPVAASRAATQLSREETGPKAAAGANRSTTTKDSSWARAAAFANRDSAERLAASIERQGYAVEVRREDSATGPWVVWIGKQSRRSASEQKR